MSIDKSWNINAEWHRDPKDGVQMMRLSGTLTVSRDSEQSKNVKISGTLTNSIINGKYYNVPPFFGQNPCYNKKSSYYTTDYLYPGITIYIKSSSSGDTGVRTNRYVYDSNHGFGDCYGVGWWVPGVNKAGGSWKNSFSANDNNLSFTSGNLELHACCRWHFDSPVANRYRVGSCDMGHTDVLLDKFNITNNPYNPYKQPSVGSLSVTPRIGIYKSQQFTYKYSISKGTENLSWVHLDAYRDGTDNCVDWLNVGTGFGNRTDNFQFGNGSMGGGNTGGKFQAQVSLHDGKNRFTTNKVDFYTYTQPNISSSVSMSALSPQDNATLSWTTNQRVHQDDSLEKVFTTTGSMNGKSISGLNQGTSGSITINDSLINDKYSASERSVKNIYSSITLTRTNTSAGDYKAISSKSFTIQYQPVNAPTSVNIKANNKALPTKIIIQDVKSIDVSWNYQIQSGAAGVVNGYYVEIFTNSSCSGTPYKTKIVADNNALGSTSINTSSELKRGVMNYIKITPFYKCPDTSKTADYIDSNHNIRGTKYYTASLCIPISKINTPEIQYPINNSTWHNKYFRILLQLPTDPDINEMVKDGTISSTSAYRYQNVQLQITYPDNTTRTYDISTNDIWSTDTYSHKKKIAICPALSSLNDVAYYKLKVRVQKNYYISTGTESWSNWSTEVRVNNKSVARQSYSSGNKIEDDHYMNPRTASVNCHGVYPIQALPSNNIARGVGDTIEYKHYKAIYDTILQIKNNVNSYCTYDRSSVSFTREITDFTENPPKQDYITADDDKTVISANDGRNYMNKLVDDLNKLY